MDAQTRWTKYSDNPVLDVGPAGSWDDEEVFAGSVLSDGTSYLMWYLGYDGRTWRTGHATSHDGINWLKYEANPVLDLGPAGSWDDNNRATAWSVLLCDTTFHMWYTGQTGSTQRIGYATSPDGVTWTKHPKNPVLDLGLSGSWDDSHVWLPTVLFDGTNFHMWYTGQAGSTRRIGYATSPDGISWTKYGNNPVLDVGPEGSWDDMEVGGASLLFQDTTFHMWYSGYDGSVHRICYATSLDGLNWRKYADNPVLNAGPTGSWDDTELWPSAVVFDGTTYHMWYGGIEKSIGGLGYATSTALPADRGEVQFRFDRIPGLSSSWVNCILQDRQGFIWVGTFDGLNRYDGYDMKIYRHDPEDSNSLSNDFVWSLYEDGSGILWIGTQGGLNRYDPITKVFAHYRHNPDDPQSLGYDEVTSILEDKDGTLWVGTKQGLNTFDPLTETFTQYRHDPQDPTTLRHDQIHVLLEDRLGTLWIGTGAYRYDVGGLNRLLSRTGSDQTDAMDHQNETTFHNYRFSAVDRLTTWITALHEDKSGRFWVCTDYGLARLDRDSGERHFYQRDDTDPRTISSNRTRSICEDETGILWIGTWEGGLNRFDPNSGRFSHYLEDPQNPNSISNNKIGTVYRDRAGIIWIGTWGGGVNKFDPAGHFGGLSGTAGFSPEDIPDESHTPPVALTSFKIFNLEAELDTSIERIKQIILPFADNYFSFEFAVLDYASPQKNQYAYMLEGLDKDWISAGTKRDVTYTNLDPGRYTFRAKGSNSNGVWNEEGTSLAIIILPPWWRTTWAYALYILLFIAASYITLRLQVKRVRLRHELEMKAFEARKLQEIDQMKSRFFANISHEFRTPLTLILGPIEKMIAKVKDVGDRQDLDTAQRNAGRLLRLINQLLDLSKMETGSLALEAREENIVPLLDRYVQTFESLAESKRIALQLEAPTDQLMVYVDRDKLEKIVSNLISNALKFTPEGGRVDVSLAVVKPEPGKRMGEDLPRHVAAGYVETAVCDTGIGIPAGQLDKVFDRFYQVDGTHTREQEGTGIGLALTKELVELHKGLITVTSEPGRGSRFTVRLPLGKDHLSASELVEESAIPEMVKPAPVAVEPGGVLEPYEIPEEETAVAPDKSAPLVLIVEDNADMRRYIRSDLEASYRIIEADDGIKGLKQAIGQVPDLAICDVMMPGMDGFQLCEKLKTDERTSHIPVILLTAKAGIENKVEGLETGADDYITKPFDVRELRVRVKNLIEQRRRLRERFRRDATLKPRDIAVSSIDERFLQRALDVVEMNMSNEDFSVDDFTREVGMSRTNLHRKLRALTDQSTTEFLRTLRLNRAALLLRQKFGNVTQVAYEVGFSNPAYFTECFKKYFGQPPSRYISTNKS